MQNVSAIIYAAAFHSRGITGARQGPAVIPGTALAAFAGIRRSCPTIAGMPVQDPYAALPAPEALTRELGSRLPAFQDVAWTASTGSTNADLLGRARPDKAPASPGCWARTCRKPAADAPAAPGRTARARP